MDCLHSSSRRRPPPPLSTPVAATLPHRRPPPSNSLSRCSLALAKRRIQRLRARHRRIRLVIRRACGWGDGAAWAGAAACSGMGRRSGVRASIAALRTAL
ncbi:Os03g0323100 [Oryza sativa Japonica Group]|uniref:Os03g0323100 protein n=1 Tax=Oryza sativa subsp. japonica TaxID=39947 RepID=Q0DSA3_ORYSJ|nr:Os03g0323100 [Oryza sativa Japonica Group]|eukprot:NP_001049971.1 Os03g0323100 [Oryza sativa Japonica Group]